MHREKLIFCGTSDLSGHVRGKAFPAADLAARQAGGVNMPPTNIMLSAFGPIHATPFGTIGELALIPDVSTHVHVDFDGAAPESFCLGDLREDGDPWCCCPRDFLRRALDGLKAQAGLIVRAAFEQEFCCPSLSGDGSFRLDSYRRAGSLPEALLGALRAAGCTPDSFVAEYAPGQFEVTVAPTIGLRAADEAVITREIIRAVAARHGHRATLAPILSPEGVGSGTHIHISLLTADHLPALHDPSGPFELSETGEAFAAGMAKYLPALCALTAPSAASYYRLRPNKWAPVTANVAGRDRGAAIRICAASPEDPARAKKFNVEFRVGDACASPYIALGAILHASLAGLRENLRIGDLGEPAKLPGTLGEALDTLEASEVVRGWMGETLHSAYLMLKRGEIASLAGLSDPDICARYAAVY
jgi:glutamine synthetase